MPKDKHQQTPDPFSLKIDGHATNIFPDTLINDIEQAKQQHDQALQALQKRQNQDQNQQNQQNQNQQNQQDQQNQQNQGQQEQSEQEHIIREESLTLQQDIPSADSSLIQIRLGNEHVAEQKQRRLFRTRMFRCFFSLLVAQHFGLAAFIYLAINREIITEIQPLLEIIVSATLAETYAIIRIMVKFVFSPGDFVDKRQKKGIR